jgi:DivIVA domain-containing protein
MWRLITNYALLGSHRSWVVVTGSIVALGGAALLIGLSRMKAKRTAGLIVMFIVLVLVAIAAAPARGGNVAYPQSPEIQFLGDALAFVFALSLGPIIYIRLRPRTLSTQNGLGSTMTFTPSHLRKATFARALKGYDVNDVDAFLREAARRIELGEKVPSASEVRFRLTLSGYDVREVDSYLESLSRATA